MTGIWKRFIFKVINKKTPEEKLRRKIDVLRELIEIEKRKAAEEPEEYVKNIMEDFYVDSIVVSKMDGSVLMADNKDNAFEKAVKNTSLYEFVKSEFPKAKTLTIKEEGKYNIIYIDNDLLYLIQTSGEISLAETKRIAQKLNTGIKDFSLDKFKEKDLVKVK